MAVPVILALAMSWVPCCQLGNTSTTLLLLLLLPKSQALHNTVQYQVQSHSKTDSYDVQDVCVTGKLESDGVTGRVRGSEGCEKADKDGGIVGHRHREN